MRKLTVIIALFIAVAFMPGQVNAATKPGNIKTITAEKTTSSITLKWSKAKKAKKYCVYKNGKKVKTQKARKYTASRLKANTVYRFKVQAVNGAKKGKAKTIAVKTNKKIVSSNSNNTNNNNTNISHNWDYSNDTSDSSTTQVESISFNKTSITMTIGDYETLYLTNAEGKNATFEIFNKNVAKVQTSGTTSVSIKAVKAGKTTIEAKCNGKTTRCSIVVKEEEQDELKYTYEVYKLKEQIYLTEEYGQYILIKTNNPNKDGFTITSENTKPSETKALSNYSVFKDLNEMPDISADGKYIYYETVYKDSEGIGTYYVTEKNGTKRTKSTNTCPITFKSQKAYITDWAKEEIATYAKNNMSKHEKMKAVCNGIKASAYYNYTSNNEKYSQKTSMYLHSMPNKITRCWDSAYKQLMWEIAEQLDYNVVDYDEAGLGSEWHAVVCAADKINSEDIITKYSYSICPAKETAKDINNCKQLRMNDYERIAVIDK